MNYNLKLILEWFGGYTNNCVLAYFPQLILKESGLHKIGNCIGFIAGLYFSGKHEEAEYFADNFIRVFSHPWIGKGSQDVEIPTGFQYNPIRKISYNKCELIDDGTALSFSFLTFRHSPEDEDISGKRVMAVNNDNYVSQLNGGIIFHGMQKQFSVTLDNNPGWQIHT